MLLRVPVLIPSERLAASKSHDLVSPSSDNRAAGREDSRHCHSGLILSLECDVDRNVRKSHLPRMAESETREDESDVGVW